MYVKAQNPIIVGLLFAWQSYSKYKVTWSENYWIQYGRWLAAPRQPEIFEYPNKIVIRQTGDAIIATIIDNKFICRNNLHICIPRNGKIELMYILGLLNSKLMDFIYTYINPEKEKY